jgi:DNA-binding NarL/FixJ family response regulator
MTQTIRVLLVDDQRMFREGIRNRLREESDIEVVGEAANAEEALALMSKTNPTTVVLDIRMPGVSGIELARMLRQGWPQLKLLVLTGYDFDQYVRAMARIGVDGYLLKDGAQDSVVAALREIAAGGAVLPPPIASKVLRGYAAVHTTSGGGLRSELTVRELEVLELMCQGLTNQEIADRLSISPRTAEAHTSSIISKLGAHDREDAVRVAARENLIR